LIHGLQSVKQQRQIVGIQGIAKDPAFKKVQESNRLLNHSW